MVVVVGLGVAGNDARDELCGCRGSGELGLVVRGTVRRMEWCYGLLGIQIERGAGLLLGILLNYSWSSSAGCM